MGKSRFSNVKTVWDGMVFDSRLERSRYVVLKGFEEAGLIENVRCQVPFPLSPDGMHSRGVYIADFVYTKDGEEVIEDVKSGATANLRTFQRKARKLLERGLCVRVIFPHRILSLEPR